MAGVNKVILLGSLGADPEVKHLESGSVVAKISLATSESYKDKQGNKVDNTEWHNVEMWDGLAKVAEQYLKVGDTIYLEGKIKSDKWTDEQGNNRKATKIRAVNMTMISKKGGANTLPADVKSGSSHKPSFEPSGDFDGEMSDTDDLPF